MEGQEGTASQVVQCECGRLWQFYELAKPIPGAALRCRCSKTLSNDADGKLGAQLIRPREHFVALRRLAFKLIVPLYPLTGGSPLQLPLWLAPHRIWHLRSPNRAMRVRCEAAVSFSAEHTKPRRWHNFWNAAMQIGKLDLRAIHTKRN